VWYIGMDSGSKQGQATTMKKVFDGHGYRL
jgi:hypothetical protein